MSRNIGDTGCRICSGEVKLDGPNHPITKAEAHRYFDEYQRKGLVVANARCGNCDAKYLAWVRMTGTFGHLQNSDNRPFVDLSFRASFNDEPAPEDLPTSECLARIARRSCLERAADLRAQAQRLTEEANMTEAGADLPSYWEGYRR